MITMWMGLAQSGWAVEPGTLLWNECSMPPDSLTPLCVCVRTKFEEDWWAPVVPPAITGTCLAVDELLAGRPVSFTTTFRAYLEERARRVAERHGYVWYPSGLVSHKKVERMVPGAEIIAGNAGTSIVVDDDLKAILTVGDLGAALVPFAELADFDSDQLADDYLVRSDDGLDVWIAYGPFPEPEVPLDPTPEQ